MLGSDLKKGGFMRRYILFLSLSVVLLSGCFVLSPHLGPMVGQPMPLQEVRVSGEGRAKVLLIDLYGVLTLEEEERPFFMSSKESPVEAVARRLQIASEDPNIAAVVLKINSPGGTVTASDVLYHEVMEFKKARHVPVVAAMLDIATSGAYYVAMAADKVVAHPTTTTGSIGVIMTHFSVEGLFEKIGVKGTHIVSGEHKDLGTFVKDLPPEDQRILQGVIDSHFETFLEAVQKGRSNLSAQEIDKLADGRIYTASQALDAGLIDRIGYLDDAIEEAKKLAGVIRATVVTYTTPDQPRQTLYSGIRSEASIPTLWDPWPALQKLNPKFYYIWSPGIEGGVE